VPDGILPGLSQDQHMPELTLISVFVLGLLGGFHCAGMCGGIVVLLNRHAHVLGNTSAAPSGAYPPGPALASPQAPAEHVLRFVQPAVAERDAHLAQPTAAQHAVRLVWPSDIDALRRQLAYSTGRIMSYTLAGALMGAVGSSSLLVGHLLPVEQAGFVLVNLLMLAFALYLWGFARSLSWLEPLGVRLWAIIAPLAGRQLRPDSLGGALAAGALWGWLPCGMVYGMLIAALASQSAQEGALLLASFGLGTLPNLVLLGLGADRLMRAARRVWVRRLAALGLAVYATAGLLRLDPRAHLIAVVDACISWVAP